MIEHSQKIEQLTQDVEILKSCIEVLSKHIQKLEKQNRKFIDRFKFKKIGIEEDLKCNLRHFKNSKLHFTLNDD